MSDKLKEFIEVPQQFIREGNQVGFAISKLSEHPKLTFRDLQFLIRCTKPTRKGKISPNRDVGRF